MQGNDGDVVMFAGPEEFLREALPDQEFSPAFLARGRWPRGSRAG
ncbi:hypothetical protein [Elioraea sp.]|nr:hypothetical protein [Elioraea sp.]